eukprot:NODE_1149_length_674_cov_1049.857600_g789_i0.p3 GENE.NODE_1149_length_674_cov_1049.857600_g789_i0~~NODE_1149_length_674_cov_1049.857600_g789_i0.p3  ORF type:complete len:71 (-),score=11.50 NODE_1149_length_674_cov_1049.857600_g789_i0:184-396(-)
MDTVTMVVTLFGTTKTLAATTQCVNAIAMTDLTKAMQASDVERKAYEDFQVQLQKTNALLEKLKAYDSYQ